MSGCSVSLSLGCFLLVLSWYFYLMSVSVLVSAGFRSQKGPVIIVSLCFLFPIRCLHVGDSNVRHQAFPGCEEQWRHRQDRERRATGDAASVPSYAVQLNDKVLVIWSQQEAALHWTQDTTEVLWVCVCVFVCRFCKCVLILLRRWLNSPATSFIFQLVLLV